MKIGIIGFIKYLFYLIIPTVSIVICRALRLAEGERNEEIIFGLFVGIVLDFIYSLFLWLTGKDLKDKNINKAIFFVFLSIVAIAFIAFVLSNAYN